MLLAIISFFLTGNRNSKKCHKIYSDDSTEIKYRKITGNCIIKPHLGKLPGSGNLDEFQLQLDSFLFFKASENSGL